MAGEAGTGIHEEDALGKAYDGRLMRRLLAFAKPYWHLIVPAILFLCGEGALQLVGPVLTKRVIDVGVPHHDGHLIRISVALFVLSLVLQFCCSYGETLLTSLLGQRVMRDLRMRMFAHVENLPVAFFDRNPVGRLVTRVTSDVESLNDLFTAGVVSGLGDLFTLVFIAIFMIRVDWRLALAAFGVIPLVWLTSEVFRVKVRASYRDIRTRIARINAFLNERLTGMRIVQLFGREKWEADRFDDLNRGYLASNLRSITIYALYFPAIEILTSVALASLIVAGAGRIHASTLTVGTLAAFLQLVRRFFQPLQDLSDKYNTLQQAMASSERIFKLLDEPEGPAQGVVTGMPRGGVTVEFEDVWFSYGNAEAPQWVLRGVSFRAEPGQTIALVGHTGAGKTTVVSLLMRFYDPQRGRILVDGVDIREMSLADLRVRIGYVQQDIFLFAGDVMTNVRLSSALSDADVQRAAARVGADRVVARLPGGWSQELGERGASISVGERQLLSFARAIAADPALLLLDEATSAVDSEIEAEIQQALAVLMQGRTTIAVAHRLSTIVSADEILVMHHGEIRERGTHRELLEQGGLYERLYRLQVGDDGRGSVARDALAASN
ncbi:MAG TPA: ABC transporter ATP-binding protein [Gemmatimonadaceae bacterium]|jgi:ATP-binding cassette subfamily B multidrug efflux pump|nr:ABC transporter ATP-binding protein [Gemmatimonadaceae bacterium]